MSPNARLSMCLLLATVGISDPATAAPAASSTASKPAASPDLRPPPPAMLPAKPGTRPSPGCQSYTITMGTRRLRVSVDGVTRDFSVVVPTGARPQNPLPVVLAWHDTGGSGGLARVYFGIEQQALAGAVFIYPEALSEAAGAGGGGGKSARWDPRPDGRDLRFFDRMLTDAGRDLCIDLARIFSVGHGSGAELSRALACHRPSAVRAVAAVGGGTPADCPATAKSPGAGSAAPAVWSAPPQKDWPPTLASRIWGFFVSLR